MDGLSLGFVTGAGREEVPALEALPIDSLWVGGHVSAPNGSPEAMALLARLSALSERVRIGTAILLVPLYPPAIVAKQIADLDRMCGGRITLGIGVGGEYEEEFRACQVAKSERGKRTDEALPLYRRLWSAEEISHEGRFYSMDKVRIHPAPAQKGGPPIIVAGRKPPAMVRAATLGDGWMPYLYSPKAYAASVEQIRAVAAENGRDLTNFEWTCYLFANIGDDAEASRDELVGFLGGAYSQDFRLFAGSVAASGTAADVAAKVQAYVDAGARHFIVSPATRGDRVGMARRFVEEVWSKVKAPV